MTWLPWSSAPPTPSEAPPLGRPCRDNSTWCRTESAAEAQRRRSDDPGGAQAGDLRRGEAGPAVQDIVAVGAQGSGGAGAAVGGAVEVPPRPDLGDRRPGVDPEREQHPPLEQPVVDGDIGHGVDRPGRYAGGGERFEPLGPAAGAEHLLDAGYQVGAALAADPVVGMARVVQPVRPPSDLAE